MFRSRVWLLKCCKSRNSYYMFYIMLCEVLFFLYVSYLCYVLLYIYYIFICILHAF